MKFSREELVALAKLSTLMIEADYVCDKKENDALLDHINKLSEDGSGAEIIREANSLNHINMIDVISRLDNEKKRYTMAFLMKIMTSDKDVEQEEIALLKFASDMCNLPYITFDDAKKIID